MDYTLYKNKVWNQCLNLYKDGIEKGLRFIADRKCEVFRCIEPAKIELAVNSRYLHRGFYCPSPVFDLVLANSRRGRILHQPTKRSKITHRYLYNAEGDIYLTEYLNDGSSTAYEYIIKEGTTKYGFVISDTGILGGISIETYHQDMIQSYLWVRCHCLDSDSTQWQADYARYETYEYDQSILSGFDLHFIALIEEEYNDASSALDLVSHEKYQTIYEDGKLVGYRRIDHYGNTHSE